MAEMPDDPRVLLQLAYAEMRTVAERMIQDAGDGAHISPSSLVHLASMRLLGQRTAVRDARHMVALAVIAMRRLLVDQARARKADRRGGGVAPQLVALEEIADEPRFGEPLAMDDALRRLAEVHARCALVVQARVFGGLSLEEAAKAVGVSASQAKRDWQVGVEWLRSHWREGGGNPAAP